jgi:hypothetical protein
MRYEVTMGNPPFNKNLHLKIIDGVIPYMAEDGVGCFVHPARWLEDPLAGYKKNPDRLKFKGIVDRLEDVKILDTRTADALFGIRINGDLMISTVKSKPTGKRTEVFSDMAKECINVIVSYSKDKNLGMQTEQDKVDGWRVQVKELLASDPHIESMSLYHRKNQCNVFGLNKVNVFYNGFSDGVEWMKTRYQTTGKKEPGSPLPYSIKFKSEKEARNFEKSCSTNFYQNIVYLLKCDMHSPLKYLPWMGDYSRPWTDRDYCRFFGALGMSEECQRWMCREVYDYRIKDFIRKEHINN